MTAAALAHSYQIRPLAPDEIPLVLSSWLRTLRADQKRRGDDIGPCHCLRCRLAPPPPDDFYAAERTRAETLLARHGAMAAVLPEVPDEVLSWACAGDHVLHYCYTKRDFRGSGLVLQLLDAAGLLPEFEVSTLTADVCRWIRDGRRVRYNPYSVLR